MCRHRAWTCRTPGYAALFPWARPTNPAKGPIRMLCTGDRPLLVGVGRDQAGVHRKSFAADQSFLDTAAHHRLEDMPERIAVAKPTVTVLREGGVIRHGTIQAEPAEPPIGQI